MNDSKMIEYKQNQSNSNTRASSACSSIRSETKPKNISFEQTNDYSTDVFKKLESSMPKNYSSI
jgi:hypothetical protein